MPRRVFLKKNNIRWSRGTLTYRLLKKEFVDLTAPSGSTLRFHPSSTSLYRSPGDETKFNEAGNKDLVYSTTANKCCVAMPRAG